MSEMAGLIQPLEMMTAQQVADALRFAGMRPVAQVEQTAQFLSMEIQALSDLLACTTLWSDPSDYLSALQGGA